MELKSDEVNSLRNIERMLYMSIERSYLDFYIWNIMLPEEYKRFVIEPGYVLAEDNEEMFIKYFSQNRSV